MSEADKAEAPALPGGYRLFSFDTTDSTNAEALRRIEADARAGDVIWARRQSAGRGRRGRDWVSPRGNLYFTLIVSAPTRHSIGQLAFVTALGVAGALESDSHCAGKIRFKWPNDICVARQKLAGILIERSTGGVNADLVAVGVGLNIAEAPLNGSVCLRDMGSEISVADLLGLIGREFHRWHGAWQSEGFEPVRKRWLAMADGLGEPITVRFPDGRTSEGRFHGIDENGALELWRPDGTCESIATGEVFFAAA